MLNDVKVFIFLFVISQLGLHTPSLWKWLASAAGAGAEKMSRVLGALRDGRQMEKLESEMISEWIDSAGGRLVLVPVKRGVVKLVGKDGSGKSSLKRSLKREMFNSELLSTEAIEIEVLYQGDDSKAWRPIIEGQIQQLVLSAISKPACDVYSKTELRQVEGRKLSKQVSDMMLKYRQVHVTPPRVIIHVCDHGGQENLFSSFAPFVAPNSVYLMVYDVSIPLEAEAQSSVRLNIEGDYQHLEVKLHRMKYNKDWINHHLSAISVSSVSRHHEQSDESSKERVQELAFSDRQSTANAVLQSSTQGIGSVFNCVSPPVIFAATHADQIVGKEQEVLSRQDAVLNKMLDHKPYTSHVYRRPSESQSPLFKSDLCFCINNTKSHSPSWLPRLFLSEEDPELVALRELVTSKIEEHCTQELIPVSWLLIEDKVSDLQGNSRDKIIPFEMLEEIGVKQCSMKSSSEVSDALCHLHNFSIVVYFASSPILRHHVFIDAQWVFTTLSRLCPLHSKGLPANLREDFGKLSKKGIMSQELVDYFLRDLKVEDRTKMLEAAELLDIVSKCQEFDKFGVPKGKQDIEYFVPSALQEDCESKIKVKCSSGEISSPSLLVLRPDKVGMFIESLFFRLLNRCVRQYPFKPSLYRNYAMLHTEDACDVELFYTYEYVVVGLRPKGSMSYEDVRKRCVETRQFIVKSVEEVKQQGLSGFEYSVCFQHLRPEQNSFLPINSDRLVSLNDYPKDKRLLYASNSTADLTAEEEKSIDIWFSSGESDLASEPMAATAESQNASTDGRNQHASESALFTGNVERDYEAVTRAVVNCGCSQWYEIGLNLGMNKDQIKSETHNKPHYTGKLHALIEARRENVAKQQTMKDLLKACRLIPQPIYDDVIQQWKKEGLGQ